MVYVFFLNILRKNAYAVLASCVTGDVQRLFLCFNGESNLPLDIPFLQLCLSFKSFLITYPKKSFDDMCHLQSFRLLNFSAVCTGFQLVVLGTSLKEAVFLQANSGCWGNPSIWEIPLPDWKLEWNVPVPKPRACVSFLPPSSPSPPRLLQAMQNRLLWVLPSPSGYTKESSWRGEPEHLKMWR